MMKVIHVVGARPNFVKIAPLIDEMAKFPDDFQQVLVHTGQHSEPAMSGSFFASLGIPSPHEFLNATGETQSRQTASIIHAFEPVLERHRPDWVIVVGDVTSTVACALVCAKARVPFAHVEAGLRSFDRTMPEEINRVVTDQLASLLFTPSQDADENLVKEGIPRERIAFVGNIMIDTLVRMLPQAKEDSVRALGLQPGKYALATFHRPSNVDDERPLSEILQALSELAQTCPVVFPVHPRTRSRIDKLPAGVKAPQLHLVEPQDYVTFLALTRYAGVVLTDSGGIQEETTYLKVPCVTVRPNTERPITITMGTNRLVATERRAIVAAAKQALSEKRATQVPKYWDGHTASRIVAIMREQAQRS